MENTPYSPHKRRASPLWWGCLGLRAPLPWRVWWVMVFQVCEFLASLSCSQKLPAMQNYLRCPSCLYLFYRDEWRRSRHVEVDSSICGFFSPTGFCHNKYKPLWLECCFCAFTTCLHCCHIWWSLAGYGRVRRGRFTHLWLCSFFLWWWWLLHCSCHPLHCFSTPVLSVSMY